METFSYENSPFLPCNDLGVGEISSDHSYYSSSEAMIPQVINSAGVVESSTPQYESAATTTTTTTITSSLSLITQQQQKRKNRDDQLTKNAKGRRQKKENGEQKGKSEEQKKSRAVAATSASNGDQEKPPAGYIHVRARRGQATDSHSLAERVRREKISERMKMLQGLVPGCDKVTGKALMLDEIINYVQSLQNQVEFLSMKLASMNHPLLYDFSQDLDTDLNQPQMEHSSSRSICKCNGDGTGIPLQDHIPMPCVLQTDRIHSTVMDTSGNPVLLHPHHHHGPVSFLHLQQGGSNAAAAMAVCDEQRRQQQLQGLLHQVVFNNNNNMFPFQ